MLRLPNKAAALAATALFSSLAGCSDCKEMKGSGSALGPVLCGGEGTPAPEPVAPPPSACQPRAVMPMFFSLLDNADPSLAGLREAVKDIGTPVCLTDLAKRQCSSDDQCAVGACTSGLCPCTAEYSPLANLLGYTFRGLAAIGDPATNPPEPGSIGSPGCLPASEAAKLAPGQRNKLCELRRALDVLLQQNGGQRLLDDPAVKVVVHSLLDYIQGKAPYDKPHYDLVSGLGRMAGADSNVCDPAAPWTLIDNLLGYLTPAVAADQLTAIQKLLADPYTKDFLAKLSAGGSSASGRQSVIILAHGLSPAILSAKTGSEALAAVNNLLDQLVYSSNSVPQSFKNEVRAVMAGTGSLLAPATGVFPPLQKLVACTASAAVRCADPASCNKNDDELLGALYDLVSRKESSGGIDLSTLVGALKTLVSLDGTGQTARTLQMVVQGIKGSDDPTEPHDVRDAVAGLAKQALTAEEGRKIVPAVQVLLDRQVVAELFTLLQDLLYKCTPPHP